MHELSYVLKITDLSLKLAKENGLNSVKKISVEAGEMTGIIDRYLEM